MFRLDGQIALVTGSTAGLGLTIAQALARQGAIVVLNGRNASNLDAAVDLLAREGCVASGALFDVGDAASVNKAIDEIVSRHGRLDILVNNAGVQRRAPLDQFGAAEFDEVLSTNLRAPFLLCQAAARHMIPAGRGRIINLGSLVSQAPSPNNPAYVASKAAIAGLTRALMVELAPHGITVNTLSPGCIETGMSMALAGDAEMHARVAARTPARRWGRPEEVGAAAVFLASSEASFINGHELIVDGGITRSLM